MIDIQIWETCAGMHSVWLHHERTYPARAFEYLHLRKASELCAGQVIVIYLD